MIKYIGSKRLLVPWIVSVIDEVREVATVRSVADLFSGSSRVGHELKRKGYFVHANDLNAYASTIATALVQADALQYPSDRVQPILDELNGVPGEAGFFTKEYCQQSMFFQEKNGMKIDAIRQQIDARSEGDPVLKAVLLTSLLLAADRVDSTTGVQMAFLKSFADRSSLDLSLRYPELLAGPGLATRLDAIELASDLDVDLVYLDPPYNQHSYLSNYHIWESLVLNDSPATYGIARKRVDCRDRKSPFNSKREAHAAMETLLGNLKVQHVLLSFNDEGFFSASEIEAMLANWGYVHTMSREHPRYVGARIGIHNLQGVKVGKVSHLTNREFLFFASKSVKSLRSTLSVESAMC